MFWHFVSLMKSKRLQESDFQLFHKIKNTSFFNVKEVFFLKDIQAIEMLIFDDFYRLFNSSILSGYYIDSAGKLITNLDIFIGKISR